MSLSAQLRELSDPRPVEFNPDQEDWDLLSGARLSHSRTYADEGRLLDKQRGVSTRRSLKRAGDSKADPRYAGKLISRRELYADIGQEASSDEVELDSDIDRSDEELESRDDEGEVVNQEAAGSDVSTKHSETENEDEPDISSEGVQERDSENGEANEGSGFTTMAMDKVREDIEKGKAVKEQIRLWDGILEGRIKLHKTLNLTNSLPQPSHMPAFVRAGGDSATSSTQQVHRELTCLLDSLLQLQHSLLLRHRDTCGLGSQTAHPPSDSSMTEEGDTRLSSDEEIPSDLGSNEECSGQEGDEFSKVDEERKQRRRKRKRKCPWRTSGYEEHISAMHTAFESYRDETIAKWDTKLRLASGKLTNKAFIQVEQSTLAQIKHVLQDTERLVQRTQLKRSVYRVLGREEEVGEESHDNHLKSHDQEIYDEDDFYHQLLRDLIERKINYTETADPVAMGRQWLALQKLRSKVKKKVDTKASKGRQIRYDIHPKLVGFMAPNEKGNVSNSSRNDLFLSLFGAHS